MIDPPTIRLPKKWTGDQFRILASMGATGDRDRCDEFFWDLETHLRCLSVRTEDT